MSKTDCDNLFKYISNCTTIEQLIGWYNLIMDSNEFNNSQSLVDINNFINNLHIRVMSIGNELIKDIYNNNLNDVMILKRKLLSLLQLRENIIIDYEGVSSDGIRKKEYRQKIL